MSKKHRENITEQEINEAFQQILHHHAIARFAMDASKEENMPEVMQVKAVAVCMAGLMELMYESLVESERVNKLLRQRPIDFTKPITKKG